MRWPWGKRAEQPDVAARVSNTAVSVSDPRFAAIFGYDPIGNYSGSEITETTVVGLSAMYRAVSIVAGTIAGLPIHTYEDTADGRVRMRSVFDAPGGPYGPTQFEWVETLVAQAMIHGRAFLRIIRNGAGAVSMLVPYHPSLVSIELPQPTDVMQPVGGKWFIVTNPVAGESIRLDARDILHIPGLSLDGVDGMGLIACARNSLGTALSGDRAAARMFDRGALMGGIASIEGDDLDDDELKAARNEINRAAAGWDNAGGIALINRALKLTPWTMTAVDAQFMESRKFSIEEVARWTGVPPHLLMQTEKQTSWGTGVESQNRGLAKFTLSSWTGRFEQRFSRVLPGSRWAEFEYAALERPNIETEIDLLIKQVQAGLLTLDEARAVRNLPPVTTQHNQGGPSGQ